MNAELPSIAPKETLPQLIDRAAAALNSARTSAEVLEARNSARVAYDAAKSAARIMKAKAAHDSLVADVHKAQANALAIRARAEMRLAEEYDAAQDRGEMKRPNNEKTASATEAVSAPDIGLSHKNIHEARRLRDAERAEPGIVQRAISGIVERGEEPTRAALHREVVAKARPPRIMNPKALWLWGCLKDFDRDGILAVKPADLLAEMTDPMRADVRQVLPRVRAFLSALEQSQ